MKKVQIYQGCNLYKAAKFVLLHLDGKLKEHDIFQHPYNALRVPDSFVVL